MSVLVTAAEVAFTITKRPRIQVVISFFIFFYSKKVNYPKARKGSQIVGYEERKRATNLFKEELHYEKCPNKEK